MIDLTLAELELWNCYRLCMQLGCHYVLAHIRHFGSSICICLGKAWCRRCPLTILYMCSSLSILGASLAVLSFVYNLSFASLLWILLYIWPKAVIYYMAAKRTVEDDDTSFLKRPRLTSQQQRGGFASRARLYGDTRQPVWRDLPEGDAEPGKMASLLKSVYRLQSHWGQVLQKAGWIRGIANPACMHHPEPDASGVVHSDDFLVVADSTAIAQMNKLLEEYEVKMTGCIQPRERCRHDGTPGCRPVE
eukprot:955514-Amphidinium_carterae.3